MLQTVFSLFLCVVATLADAPWNTWPPPPAWQDKAHMARYLIHYGNWGVMSSYSPEYQIPFGTVQSFADGSLKNSTGIPYFFIASISDTYKNIHYNNSATLTVSMAESEKCRHTLEDPEEPPCARVSLVGKVIKVTDPSDLVFAKRSLHERHPAMKFWPKEHDWDFYKFSIAHVHLLDFYGGATHLPLKDYFAASP